jgi:DNA (cytosine-5)-methyltransferase 1
LAGQVQAPTGGTRRRDAAPVTRPMATRTTTENDAVVVPPGAVLTVLRSDRSRTIPPRAPLATVVADGSNHALVVPLEGRDGQRSRGTDEPLRAQTTRHQDALVVPLRNNGVARPASSAPLVTVAAGGKHQALVMRNNDTQAGNQGYLSTPVGEPLRTLTTAGHQSLVSTGTPCTSTTPATSSRSHSRCRPRPRSTATR